MTGAKTIAVLATLDTKGQEAAFIREQLRALGSDALLVDIGVLGDPSTAADVSREAIAEAGGTPLATLRGTATREAATPVMAAGAIAELRRRLEAGDVHGVIGLGGLQGTALATQVMRALPYGVAKVMVSTVASGDVAPYVDIKDITMMFSVGDILGLNPVTRRILANAAGAAHGMAQIDIPVARQDGGRPLIGMTNLGVLTRGAMHALELFAERGYEVIVFHAVGSGGRAMEQLMREGVIGAVFDYALGEIADEVFDGLRAGSPDRLTVAGKLGLPQVIVPGGAEHLGLLVEPHTVPERWADHAHTFHTPVVLAPRLNGDELREVARVIGERLQHTAGDAVFMIPRGGTGSYAREGGPLRDPEADVTFFAALRAAIPPGIEIVERDEDAEDPAFVANAVDRLLALIERRAS